MTVSTGRRTDRRAPLALARLWAAASAVPAVWPAPHVLDLLHRLV